MPARKCPSQVFSCEIFAKFIKFFRRACYSVKQLWVVASIFQYRKVPAILSCNTFLMNKYRDGGRRLKYVFVGIGGTNTWNFICVNNHVHQFRTAHMFHFLCSRPFHLDHLCSFYRLHPRFPDDTGLACLRFVAPNFKRYFDSLLSQFYQHLHHGYCHCYIYNHYHSSRDVTVQS